MDYAKVVHELGDELVETFMVRAYQKLDKLSDTQLGELIAECITGRHEKDFIGYTYTASVELHRITLQILGTRATKQ